jgi:pimeloyl-ACP methyl ester carboxylesterase
LNLLIVPGIGMDKYLWNPVIQELLQINSDLDIIVAELSGMANSSNLSAQVLDQLIDELYGFVKGKEYEPWIIYGQGAGAALLLELAARSFEFKNGQLIMPDKVILHGAIGAQFHLGPFIGVSSLYRSGSGLLGKFLNQKLLNNAFVHPQNVEEQVKQHFVQRCKSNTFMASSDELFSKKWYDSVKYRVETNRCCFLSGEFEPEVNSKTIIKTRGDFPGSEVRLIKGWKQYPMLEQPAAFADYLVNQVIFAEKEKNALS